MYRQTSNVCPAVYYTLDLRLLVERRKKFLLAKRQDKTKKKKRRRGNGSGKTKMKPKANLLPPELFNILYNRCNCKLISRAPIYVFLRKFPGTSSVLVLSVQILMFRETTYTEINTLGN